MKKIILFLFLILGVVSFAIPNYVNTEKIKNSGYEVTEESDDLPKRVYKKFQQKNIWVVNVIGGLIVKDGQLQVAALSVSFHKGR